MQRIRLEVQHNTPCRMKHLTSDRIVLFTPVEVCECLSPLPYCSASVFRTDHYWFKECNVQFLLPSDKHSVIPYLWFDQFFSLSNKTSLQVTSPWQNTRHTQRHSHDILVLVREPMEIVQHFQYKRFEARNMMFGVM